MKRAIYRLAKSLGLFRLAQIITARRLRIICYHGLSLNDEHVFQPRLFMHPETFRRRLEILKNRNYVVLSLEQGLDGISNGTLPAQAVVVTFDDGFFSNYSIAVPLLSEVGFPATIYVTTYYVLKQSPVFRLVIRYVFWKTRGRRLDLKGILGRCDGSLRNDGSPDSERMMWEIITHGEEQLDEAGRRNLAEEVARRLGVDFAGIVESRTLGLMSPEEIFELSGQGVDVQLHTHRHRFPLERDAAIRELRENGDALTTILGARPLHFCYPSGQWSQEHWPWLEDARIRSAVTCDPGLNDRSTMRYGLKRYLDSESSSDIEFEAELSGFAEILRCLFKRRGGQHVRDCRNSRA